MIARDIFYALRTLRQRPVLAVTASLTLALAIGGNTAMFTVIHAVLLKPLPYHDSGRLAQISGSATPARFLEMKAAARSFSGLGAFTREEDLALSGPFEPEILKSVRISANFLKILGVKPILGREFRANEDMPGAPPVVMISAELWARRFASDPRIAGKTATIGSISYTIAGVLPPRFQFPSPGLDVWLTDPQDWPAMAAKSRALSPFLTLFARLKPGVSMEEANAELKVIRHQYAAAHPAMLDAKAKTPELTAMKDELVSRVRSMLWMLFGAVGLVLLIACANVAGLLLSSAAARSREFAVRSALGAGRGRLISQLLTESVLLAGAGGVLGLMLASAMLRLVPAIPSMNIPRAGEIQLDWAVLGFAAGLSFFTGILFGLAPSWSASRPDLVRMLRASGEASASGSSVRSRLGGRSALSVAQIALSMVLLIGAALLIQSVDRLRRVDVGFNPKNLLTLSVSLPLAHYKTGEQQSRFFEELVQRVNNLPGARGAAAAMYLPMMGSYAGTPVQDAAKPPLRLNQRPIATLDIVTPGYFHALRIPLRQGRAFTDRDTADAPRAAVINETLARRFWPDRADPLGLRILVGGVSAKPAEIVGVAADVHQNLENTAWPEMVYLSLAQDPQPSAMLAVRSEGPPLAFSEAVRRTVRAIDSAQPVSDIETMESRVEKQTGERRALEILLGAFAGVALLLSLIGIYGVVAFSVVQRTQEMGIRRALGAQRSDIFRLVLVRGFGIGFAGITLGLGAAFALTRVMKAVLFGVSTTDPATFAVVAGLFLLAALGASYFPAHRAAAADPMDALRG